MVFASDEVNIEGDTFHAIFVSIRKQISDILYMSRIKDNSIQLSVPEGDFGIKINDYPGRRLTRLDIRVTFREPEEAGGTWWSQWFVNVPYPRAASYMGRLLVKEITESRRYFARLIEDTKAAALHGSMPVLRSPCGDGKKLH